MKGVLLVVGVPEVDDGVTVVPVRLTESNHLVVGGDDIDICSVGEAVSVVVDVFCGVLGEGFGKCVPVLVTVPVSGVAITVVGNSLIVERDVDGDDLLVAGVGEGVLDVILVCLGVDGCMEDVAVKGDDSVDHVHSSVFLCGVLRYS